MPKTFSPNGHSNGNAVMVVHGALPQDTNSTNTSTGIVNGDIHLTRKEQGLNDLCPALSNEFTETIWGMAREQFLTKKPDAAYNTITLAEEAGMRTMFLSKLAGLARSIYTVMLWELLYMKRTELWRLAEIPAEIDMLNGEIVRTCTPLNFEGYLNFILSQDKSHPTEVSLLRKYFRVRDMMIDAKLDTTPLDNLPYTRQRMILPAIEGALNDNKYDLIEKLITIAHESPNTLALREKINNDYVVAVKRVKRPVRAYITTPPANISTDSVAVTLLLTDKELQRLMLTMNLKLTPSGGSIQVSGDLFKNNGDVK